MPPEIDNAASTAVRPEGFEARAEIALPPTDRGRFLHVASLNELETQGVLVVRGTDRPIAVFSHQGKVFAVDNRCPHMGFPLHRGTVHDGILTCHWHNARFDLSSGCTFDLFADDVPAYDVQVREGQVYVGLLPRQGDMAAAYRRRLEEGLEQNIALVQAKGLIGLLRSGVDPREIIRQIALFGVRNRDGWAGGLTSLTALAALVPHLSEDTAYFALYQGAVRVAEDCAGRPPRRDRQPLDTAVVPLDTLRRWLLSWTEVRHRDAAERTVLTAVCRGSTPAQLGDLLCSAATSRFYADGGHVLDFCNKAMELLDMVGWEHAEDVLPTVLSQLVSARGGEEMSHWRSPIDLVSPLRAIEEELPGLLDEGAGKAWDGVRALGDALLGEDPLAILQALRDALKEGAQPVQISKAICYAAAMRVARFGPSNEVGDWVTVLHTFTHCNALHQALKRSPSPGVLRGVFAAAMAVYADRFLNVPPARLPGERDSLDGEPHDAGELLTLFLGALDGQRQAPVAARAVARYLALGHPLPPLWDALAWATVREDADFHTIQMLEAGLRQSQEWEGKPEAAHILIAVARYLAAHSPTQRARLQTARIALRLHRGEDLSNSDGIEEERID